MSLWWLQRGWTDTRCSCGAKIWPEADPDGGSCTACISAAQDQEEDISAYWRSQDEAYTRDLEASYDAEMNRRT